MRALRVIKETTEDGTVQVKVPRRFGRRVEIIILPLVQAAEDSNYLVCEDLDEEELFLAAAYQAVTEEDEEEDEIWRSYLK